MGRSVDHLLTDCYLGQLSPYLKISALNTLPICTHLKINPVIKKYIYKKRRISDEVLISTLERNLKRIDKSAGCTKAFCSEFT